MYPYTFFFIFTFLLIKNHKTASFIDEPTDSEKSKRGYQRFKFPWK